MNATMYIYVVKGDLKPFTTNSPQHNIKRYTQNKGNDKK